MWKKNWKDGKVKNEHLVNDPTQRVPCFDFPRAIYGPL